MPRKPVDPDRYPRQAAEEIRKFNHATYATTTTPRPIPYPGTLYHATGAFKTLADRLPQAYGHLSTALRALADDGHLTADYGRVDDHVTDAVAALHEAQDLAHALSTALNRAHSATSPLGYSGPIPDET